MEGHTTFDGTPVCDCSEAWDPTGLAAGEVKRYVGKFCQTDVTEADYCPGPNGISRELFCINGGECRASAVNYDDKPCRCINGFKVCLCKGEKGKRTILF